MQTKIFNDVSVSGLACALPTKRVFTDEYQEYFGEDEIKQFKEVTGIESRYLSNGKQTASDLCYVAARELLKMKGLTGKDIDALVFFTQSADYKTPSTAFILQERLSIKEDCFICDINLGCSAFVNSLYMMAAMIQGKALERALIMIGDARLEHSIYKDPSMTMMFGDAGSACLLEKGEGTVRALIRSDGSGYRALIRPVPGDRFPHGHPCTYKDGFSAQMKNEDVFIFTMKKVPQLFKDFFAETGSSIDEYDYCLLHQANLMILKTIAKKLKLPIEKMPVSLERYGNTDGASIPLGIVDLCTREEIKEDLRLITSGFGIGLSWGLADFSIKSSDVLPPIFTDEYFAEGFEV